MVAIASVTALVLVFVFIYLLVYQKNRIVGNIFFMVLGLATSYVFLNNQEVYLGIIMFCGGMGSFIYDFFTHDHRG